MERIRQVFATLEEFKKLPDYQLERRLDIFFAIHLKDILEAHFSTPGFSTSLLIPEFPLNKGIIKSAALGLAEKNGFGALIQKINMVNENHNLSIKADYLLINFVNQTAYLIELKTDLNSKGPLQEIYMLAAKKAGISKAMEGLLKIYTSTKQQKKYSYLLNQLDSAKLIGLTRSFKASIEAEKWSNSQQIIKEELSKQGLETLIPPDVIKKIEVVYLQPCKKSSSFDSQYTVIDFAEMAKIIQEKNATDSVSLEFAKFLSQW